MEAERHKLKKSLDKKREKMENGWNMHTKFGSPVRWTYFKIL
jgi:hypothetical protein